MLSLLRKLDAEDADIFLKCFRFYQEITPNYSRDNHENHKHMFQEDSRIIRRIASKQKSLLKKDNIFGFFVNFAKSYFSGELRQKVLTVLKESPIDSIFWCCSLVLNNHICNRDNNCLLFLRPVIKLFLLSYKAIDYGTIVAAFNCCQYEIYLRLHRYVQLIKECNFDLKFLEDCFKVFVVDNRVLACFFESTTNEDMHFTLGAIQKLRFVTEGLLRSEETGLDISHRCMAADNLQRFKILLDYGASNNYSTQAIGFYVNKIKLDNLCLNNFLNYHDGSLPRNRYTMRAYQTIYIYGLTPKVRARLSQSKLIESSMRMLWATIPDPFLTRDDIVYSFGDPNRDVEALLRKVWTWYSKYVSRDTRNVYEARSLKHLCRCVIRNELSSNFQLPHGVELLSYPSPLKRYLLLQECEYPVRHKRSFT